MEETNFERNRLELLGLASTASFRGQYLKASKNAGQALRIAIPKEPLVIIGIDNSDARSSIKAFTDEPCTCTHP